MPKSFRILFHREERSPIDHRCIKHFVRAFPKSYHEVVRRIIESSERLSHEIFEKNIARLMPPFKMTRRGAFHGLKMDKDGYVIDPKGVIDLCWNQVEDRLPNLKAKVIRDTSRLRNRVLADLSLTSDHDVFKETFDLFEKLRRVGVKSSTGRISYVGRVGASKILFAVLPEIALPVDNAEWTHVFRTENYEKVLTTMASEIIKWEKETGRELEDINPKLTWPAVYNVMAMAARPQGS